MKAFQAYASGARVTEPNARAAARKFFETYPTRRKCDIIEGEADEHRFTVRISLLAGNKLQSWRDITKKQVETLPE
jgi:hypothetical protein